MGNAGICARRTRPTPLRQMDRQAAEAARLRASVSSPVVLARAREGKPWDRLDRALRATDQLLQSGDFRVVVLDFGQVIADGTPQQVFSDPAVIASYTGVPAHA